MKTRTELLNDLSAELAKQAPSTNINDFSNGWTSAIRYIYLRLSAILALHGDMVMVPRSSIPNDEWFASMVCLARNDWAAKYEDNWLETDENHPDDYMGGEIRTALLEVLAAIKKEKGE